MTDSEQTFLVRTANTVYSVRVSPEGVTLKRVGLLPFGIVDHISGYFIVISPEGLMLGSRDGRKVFETEPIVATPEEQGAIIAGLLRGGLAL